MAARFFLPALALAGTALAQCSGDVTINSSADASALSSCTKYDGTVTIGNAASGQIALEGVTSITGDLVCKNASQLTSLSASSLQEIQGTWDLEEIQILSSLQFSAIQRVNRILWVALPGLQSLNFGTTGVTQANQVYISNTGLTDLRGIELEACANMDINNNQYLKTINVNSLSNVTSALSFSANGMNLAVDFPNLENAGNLTFRNVSSISMPSLATVPGSIGFYSNNFQSFAAPNLTSTGNTIAFADNANLNNLSFPSLTTIGGGLLIANNSQLNAINGLPELATINGDINFYGTFDSVAFPSLTDVKGAANVYTSSTNNSICDLFNRAHTGQAIKGNVHCETSSKNTANNGTATTSGSGSSKSSGAAVRTLNYDPTAPLTGLAAFVAAVLFI